MYIYIYTNRPMDSVIGEKNLIIADSAADHL